jgi:hypothetical protein
VRSVGAAAAGCAGLSPRWTPAWNGLQDRTSSLGGRLGDAVSSAAAETTTATNHLLLNGREQPECAPSPVERTREQLGETWSYWQRRLARTRRGGTGPAWPASGTIEQG